MSPNDGVRQVRQVRVKLLDALSTGTGPKAAFQLRRGVWGVEAHLSCDAVYASGKDHCANLMAGELTQRTAVDPDGQRLNRLIQHRRRQIARANSLRAKAYRLIILVTTITGAFL